MRIATHNGVFQADDVFAVAALLIAYPDAYVIRTRDPQQLATADIVVDVGGVYDHDKRRYDHHQRGRAGERENGVPYSAFGLVWKHLGMMILQEELRRPAKVSDPYGVNLPAVWMDIDKWFVQGIDALDNGMDVGQGPMVHIPSVSEIIAGFNPIDDQPLPAGRLPVGRTFCIEDSYDLAFAGVVMGTAGAILRNVIRRAQAKELGRQEILTAINLAEKTDPRIVLLRRGGPWQEEILANAPKALYVVFQAPGEGTWMAQCVPDALGSFGKRKALPEAWGGLRDEELQRVTGVADAVFCHPGLFICGARTPESAIRLAQLSCAMGE